MDGAALKGFGASAAVRPPYAMRDHKSLLAWQEANEVVKTVMRGARGHRHPCIEQLQRAALSVQLNIAEGYALRSSKRFLYHLDVAYASAVETADLLELSEQIGFMSGELVKLSVERCHRCQQLLRGLINRLRKA
jgi:four helix bundle protein